MTQARLRSPGCWGGSVEGLGAHLIWHGRPICRVVGDAIVLLPRRLVRSAPKSKSNPPPPSFPPPTSPPYHPLPPLPAPPPPYLGASSVLRTLKMFMGARVNDVSHPFFGTGPSQILPLRVYNMPTVSTISKRCLLVQTTDCLGVVHG